MNYVRSNCRLCGWYSNYHASYHLAGCEASWHVYEEHREEWIAAIGEDRPPVDQDPRKAAQS